MLRLEKLELQGFKSFFSRTEFHFDRDITAIVGPNGCGKSNIGDALNWVIGEQSVKSLRGDRMEDVIFNGSEARKALGMAEVSLHLTNGNGDGTHERIAITRRLFRSGESEYLINGERTRLRDIQDLLARINVGSGVYSIIEQGKVDAALSSRPRDRRALIEEAAGISIYKTKKRQAEAKLEATEVNLSRVNDIVAEVERQTRSLKRQAARARRFDRLKQEIERHERIVFFHEHRRLDADRDAARSREQAARAHEAEAAAALSRIEADHEEGRRALEEEERVWREDRDALHVLDRELDRHERDVAQAREQAADSARGGEEARRHAGELTGRLEAFAREIAARRQERGALEEEADRQQAEGDRLAAEKEDLEGRLAQHEAELTRVRAKLLETVDALSETRNRRRHAEESLEKTSRQSGSLGREEEEARAELTERAADRERLETALGKAESETAAARRDLEALRASLDRIAKTLETEKANRDDAHRTLYGNEERLRTIEEIEAARVGTRDLLDGLMPHQGILADGMKVEARLEAAVDLYLGAYLDAAIVRDADEALRGIVTLRRTGKGRAGFLAADAAGAAPSIAIPDEVRRDPDFLGRLADLIEVDPTRARALAPAMARACVVRDAGAAMRLRRHAPFFDFLTVEGDIVHTSGLIEGGARRPESAGILTRRRAKTDLMMAIESGRSRIASLEGLLAGLEADRAAGAERQETLAEEVAAAEKDLVALRHRAEAAREEEARARRKVDTIGRERDMARAESESLSRDRERLAVEVTDLEGARADLESRGESLQKEAVSLREGHARVAESLAAVRSTLKVWRQRLEALDGDLARMLETDQDYRDRIDRETRTAADLTRRGEEARRIEAEASAAIEEKSTRRAALADRVREAEVILGEKRTALEARGHEVRTARGRLEEARAQRETHTIERERIESDLRHLVSTATGGDPGRVETLIAAVSEEERALDPEALMEDLGNLRARRDRIGPVNMMALDQFRELEERARFLTAQRKDLVDAVASLKETIARINRTSRERFMEAFESIRARFSEIYASLFQGGRADLRLMTDEEPDVLECGMEISAQPPGKRLQSVTLLSGGEKALTALALIFAIFRYRPSPFCLLDEVDAPLDEANVIRFSDLLKSMAQNTQFVLITHNRGSMETADVLYGITMEEPGISRTMSVILEGATNRAEAIESLPGVLRSRSRNGRREAAVTTAGAPTGGNGSGARAVPAGGPIPGAGT